MTCTEYSLESWWFGIAGRRRDNAQGPGFWYISGGIDRCDSTFCGPLVITPFPGSPWLVNNPIQLVSAVRIQVVGIADEGLESE